MKTDQTYYLLALSHNHIRFYKGDKYGLEPLAIKNLPDGMKETLNIDEYPNWRETHSIAPASSGKGSEGYHGQYNVRQTDKDMLLEFFRRVDKSLHRYLLGKRDPLVLAGVNYLLPIYQRANTYPYLAARGVAGNTERMSLDELHERVWAVSPFARPKVAA